MPQLDLVTFPSQVFWLSIFFIVFYSLVAGYFVPLLHKIIRVRSKKSEIGNVFDSDSGSDNSGVVGSGSDNLFVSSFERSVSCSTS